MPPALSVFLILFLAIFTQSVLGFGSALISMGVLSSILGLQTAAPFFAIIALVLEIILVIHYRQAFNLQNVWKLTIGALLATPLGLYALKTLPEQFTLTLLGVFLIAYALYALSGLQLPELHHPAWAYSLGFLSGLIGSAYNTGGPPVIIYGNCRRWSPAEFKANLQGFFLVNSLAIALGHGMTHSYTPAVWQYVGVGLLATVLGIIAGTCLDRFLNPVLFREIVLWGLIFLGIQLLIS